MVSNSNSDWGLLRLRAIESGDLPTIQQWQTSPELRDQFVGWPLPINENQVREWWLDQDRTPTPQKITFCIEYDNEPVGVLSVSELNWIHRSGSVSIYIGESGLRGKGLGKKSLLISSDFVFRSLGFQRLAARIAADNLASIQAFKSVGFSHEGTLRNYYFLEGSWSNAVLMGLLTSDDRQALPLDANSLGGRGLFASSNLEEGTER